MKRFCFLLFLAACTPADGTDGLGGGSGTAGSAGSRGPPGPTGEQGPPGAAGSADDRVAILNKLSGQPFIKSAPVQLFGGITVNTAASSPGGFPELTFTSLSSTWSQNVLVPLDATPGKDATVRYVVVDQSGRLEDCGAAFNFAAGRAFREGAARPGPLVSPFITSFTIPLYMQATRETSAGVVNPGDVVTVLANRASYNGGGTVCSPGAVALVAVYLVYESAVP